MLRSEFEGCRGIGDFALIELFKSVNDYIKKYNLLVV